MRKIFLTLAMGAIAMSYSVAQDSDETASMDADVLTSKKGVAILPTTDAWGVSINGSGILDFFGTAFNGNAFSSSAGTFQFVNGGQQIRVKMFKDASTAYRAGININYNSSSAIGFQTQNGATGTGVAQVAQVEDKYTNSSAQIELMAGMEMRRGQGRLQGYYGGQAWISMGGGNTDKFEYGNAYDAANNADLGDGAGETSFSAELAANGSGLGNNLNIANSYRVLKRTESGGFGVGVAAFIGAEFFFAPQMSIGGEFTWGLGLNMGGGKISEEREFTNGGTPATETYELQKGTGSLSLGTGNLGGDVMINFYF